MRRTLLLSALGAAVVLAAGYWGVVAGPKHASTPTATDSPGAPLAGGR